MLLHNRQRHASKVDDHVSAPAYVGCLFAPESNRARGALSQATRSQTRARNARAEEEWRNPLMGWTSGKDSMKQVMLKFDSKAEAIAYCERNGAVARALGGRRLNRSGAGHDYEVEGERFQPQVPKAYADNFKYKPPTATFDGQID